MNTDPYYRNALDHFFAELNLRPDVTEVLSEMQEIYPEFKVELEEAASTWEDLNNMTLPVTSEQMDRKFYDWLQGAQLVKKESNGRPKHSLATLWRYAAVGLICLAAGFLINRKQTLPAQALVPIKVDSQQGLLQHASFSGKEFATDQLTRIHESRYNASSDKTLQALYRALTQDPSTNVRLSAVETLLHFSDQAEARTYLIKAIPMQQSSIVQIALADAMIELEADESLQPMRDLLDNSSLDLEVKDHLEHVIENLLY